MRPSFFSIHPESLERNYLRVETKFPAKAIGLDGSVKNVVIGDISSTGISLLVDKGTKLPVMMAVEFKLSALSKPIKTNLTVKSRYEDAGKVRLGCAFGEMPSSDTDRIAGFIKNRLDTVKLRALSINAAFLFSIDSLLRLFTFAMTFYYLGTGIGAGVPDGSHPLYGTALVFYTAMSIGSFIIIGGTSSYRARRRFYTGIFLLMASIIFLSIRSALLILDGTINSGFIFTRVVFGWQAFLVSFGLIALASAKGTGRKLELVYKTLEDHQIKSGGDSAPVA